MDVQPWSLEVQRSLHLNLPYTLVNWQLLMLTSGVPVCQRNPLTMGISWQKNGYLTWVNLRQTNWIKIGFNWLGSYPFTHGKPRQRANLEWSWAFCALHHSIVPATVRVMYQNKAQFTFNTWFVSCGKGKEKIWQTFLKQQGEEQLVLYSVALHWFI